ncbi:type II toxin-antitoxin system VapC family toxin [Rubrimonas sp.]|uniref:type II toxin-antitoxin system VapC family toxin n=1 Tax=Rubrimonas sp. TaxID=2036015 RepID=UPI002FDEFE50
MSAVLLDTCAVLWLAAGVAPSTTAAEAIEVARRDDAVLVSAMSAWEIAQKHRRRPADLGLAVAPAVFWRCFTNQPGVRTAQLSADILMASVAIEGLETKDPVDRMLVATAEAFGARLVTGDTRILAHLRTALPYGPSAPRREEVSRYAAAPGAGRRRFADPVRKWGKNADSSQPTR